MGWKLLQPGGVERPGEQLGRERVLVLAVGLDELLRDEGRLLEQLVTGWALPLPGHGGLRRLRAKPLRPAAQYVRG